MHRLDNHINDIEPRIKAIYENAPRQEEPSLQASLCSYGWILLDSWVAWRTLRFLLKETLIDDMVADKWFQTPSSYTASQLKAIWKFSESTINYLKTCTGKSFKELIDVTIQVKRNSSAHFSRQTIVLGADSQDIKKIFQELSKIFMFYESANFIKIACNKFTSKGYREFKIYYSDQNIYEIENLLESLALYVQSNEFTLKCYDKDNRECIIIFDKDGCKAGKVNAETNKSEVRNVSNSEQVKYNFFKNKGFYRNIDLFVNTIIESCWN